MNEKLKILKGQVFFEKDNFKKSYDATLNIENETFYLEVKEEYFSNSDFEIIQGEFQELGFVTLVKCYFSGMTSSTVSTFRYRILYIIEGIKIDNSEQLNFTSLYIEMPILKKWLNKPRIKGSLVFQNKIEYLGTEKFDLFKNEEFDLTISLFCKESYSQAKIIIEEYAELKITCSQEEMSLFNLLDIYRRTKLLLSFIGNYHSGVDHFHLKQENVIYENQEEPLTMKLFTSSFTLINNPNYNFTFSYDDLIGDYQTIFNCWFKDQKIQDSINLVLEKKFLKLSAENYFLNTCFALETLHRNHFKNNVYDADAYEKIKNGILEKLNKEEEKLFLDKLQYANEPSLRNRFRDFEEDLSIVLIGDYNPNKIIRKIINTRNYLVHRDSKKNILESKQMSMIAIILENIVKLNIFKLIGIDENKIKTKVRPINYDSIFN